MLYLLRHGETEWNRSGRRQGRSDSALTARGREQARACGETLARKIADFSKVEIHTSPLGRARTTAEIVRARVGIPGERVTVVDDFAEQDVGCWQGFTNAQIDRRFPGARTRRERDKWNYVIPGGESYAMVWERLLPRIVAYREPAVVIVVAHEVVSRVVRGIYLGLGPAQTLTLSHPHTRIYMLANGRVSSVDVAADFA